MLYSTSVDYKYSEMGLRIEVYITFQHVGDVWVHYSDSSQTCREDPCGRVIGG